MFGVFSCVLIGFCLFTLCPLLLVLSLGAPEKHLAYFLYTLSPGIYTHRGSPTEPFLLQDEQSQLFQPLYIRNTSVSQSSLTLP